MAHLAPWCCPELSQKGGVGAEATVPCCSCYQVAKGEVVDAWDPVPFSVPQGQQPGRSSQCLTGSMGILCSQASWGSRPQVQKVIKGETGNRLTWIVVLWLLEVLNESDTCVVDLH